VPSHPCRPLRNLLPPCSRQFPGAGWPAFLATEPSKRYGMGVFAGLRLFTTRRLFNDLGG
jgi:hypothetical protein